MYIHMYIYICMSVYTYTRFTPGWLTETRCNGGVLVTASARTESLANSGSGTDFPIYLPW